MSENKNNLVETFKKIVGRLPTNEEIKIWNSNTFNSLEEFASNIAAQTTRPVPLTELEKKKIEDARVIEQQYQSQAAIDKQKQEEEARRKATKLEEEKEISEYKAQFYGETPEHTTWRNRLYAVTQQGIRTNTPELQKERVRLLHQYINKHYEFGTRTFTPVLMYQSINKDIRILSEDNGHTWIVQELMHGQWVRGSKTVIAENGKPIRLAQYIENAGLYDLLKTGVYADFLLNLNEESKPVPKSKEKK